MVQGVPRWKKKTLGLDWGELLGVIKAWVKSTERWRCSHQGPGNSALPFTRRAFRACSIVGGSTRLCFYAIMLVPDAYPIRLRCNRTLVNPQLKLNFSELDISSRSKPRRLVGSFLRRAYPDHTSRTSRRSLGVPNVNPPGSVRTAGNWVQCVDQISAWY